MGFCKILRPSPTGFTKEPLIPKSPTPDGSRAARGGIIVLLSLCFSFIRTVTVVMMSMIDTCYGATSSIDTMNIVTTVLIHCYCCYCYP